MKSPFTSVGAFRQLLPLLVVLVFATLAMAEDDTINELIKKLGSPNLEIRDEAAKQLRKSYVSPERDHWQELLAKTKPGDSKEDIRKRFSVGKNVDFKAANSTGPVHLDQYWLDTHWMLSGWFHNSDDSLKEAWLVEHVLPVRVNPMGDFSGVWITYFANGQKYHEINYKNGKKHGTSTSYRADGSRSYIQNFKSGVIDGEYTGYYRTGEVIYRGVYSAGKKTGIWTRYQRDGSISIERDYPPQTEAQVTYSEQLNSVQARVEEMEKNPCSLEQYEKFAKQTLEAGINAQRTSEQLVYMTRAVLSLIHI